MATPLPSAAASPARTRARRWGDTYFRTVGSPDLDAIRNSLWKHEPPTDPAEQQAYFAVVLEQYKIYTEMADRISARRGLANTFFLTLNTAIFTLVAAFWQNPPTGARWPLVVPWLALVGQCLAWFWILRSYRHLNTAKYAVVGVLEERLPASPYWAGEWTALGRGEDPSRYWPLSHVEQWLPAFFAAAYTAGLIALLFS